MDAPVVAVGPLPAFVVDRMLGRLARWLRILGHDVRHGPHLGGRALVECARRERRLLLTRDTRLLRDPELPPHVFITSDHFRDQLRQLAAVVALGGGFLCRCLDCNAPLEDVAPEAAAPHVPPYVRASQARFRRCPRCRRIYWPATHRTHMREELSRLGLAAAAEGTA